MKCLVSCNIARAHESLTHRSSEEANWCETIAVLLFPVYTGSSHFTDAPQSALLFAGSFVDVLLGVQ